MYHEDGTKYRYCKYCDTYIWDGHPHIESNNEWVCWNCAYLRKYITEEKFKDSMGFPNDHDFAIRSDMTTLWFDPRMGYPEGHPQHDFIKSTRAEIENNRQKFYNKLANRDGEFCNSCGNENNLCIDHIIPVSKSGGNEMENLQLLCPRCNSQKSDRPTEEWKEGKK